MENFTVLYGSIIRFKDKIPIFSYYVKLENDFKETLVQTLNYFIQITSVGAFPGGREVFPFEHGIIYSIYNMDLTLMYVVITKKENILDQQVFLFIEECVKSFESEIDFLNLDKLSKNKYSMTFLNVYEELIQKYNAESSNTFERLDRKIVRVLSTMHKGMNALLKNKENLEVLQNRMSSFAMNAKQFKDKTQKVKKNMRQQWYKVVSFAIILGIVIFLIIFFC